MIDPIAVSGSSKAMAEAFASLDRTDIGSEKYRFRRDGAAIFFSAFDDCVPTKIPKIPTPTATQKVWSRCEYVRRSTEPKSTAMAHRKLELHSDM